MNNRLKLIYLFSITVPLLGLGFTAHGMDMEPEKKHDQTQDEIDPSAAQAFFTDLKTSKKGGFDKGSKKDAITHGKTLLKFIQQESGRYSTLEDQVSALKTERDTIQDQLKTAQDSIKQKEACCAKATQLNKEIDAARKDLYALLQVQDMPIGGSEPPQLTGAIHRTQQKIQDLKTELEEANRSLEAFDDLKERCRSLDNKLQDKAFQLEDIEKQLGDCQSSKKISRTPPTTADPTYTHRAMKAGAFIYVKGGLSKGIKKIAPSSAPKVLGVPVGNAEQASEFVVNALYDARYQEFDLPDFNDINSLKRASKRGLKSGVRELGWTAIKTVGDKTGINQKLNTAYHNSAVPEFLERHTTTKAAVETFAFFTAGVARIATDVLLEDLVWSRFDLTRAERKSDSKSASSIATEDVGAVKDDSVWQSDDESDSDGD